MAYMRQAWYVAAYSGEVQSNRETELFHRKLLDQDIVIFRKKSGELVGMVDRCPHRFAPLHKGKIIDDTIQCGYHGLRFGCSGQCVENPHGNGFIPTNAVTRVLPLLERFGLIWIWMGSAPDANPELVPDYSFLVDTARSVVAGHHLIKCSYELVNDNLADLTHVQYVHAGYQQSEDFDKAKYEVSQSGRTVQNKYSLTSVRVSPLWGKYLKDPDLIVDRWMETVWYAPSLFTINAGVTKPGDSRGNKLGSVVAAHILTPETETTTHYFYAHTRDYGVGDAAIDDVVREWQRVGFREQDQPFLEGAQERMGTSDLMSLNPVLLATDAGAVRIRRQLRKLIAAERIAASDPARVEHG